MLSRRFFPTDALLVLPEWSFGPAYPKGFAEPYENRGKDLDIKEHMK